VSFPFWFTDVVSALDSLTLLGLGDRDPDVHEALGRLRSLQRPDGTFALKLVRGADKDLPLWIALAVGRIVQRLGRTAPREAR
jgi:prenyltransferase beta subunit